MGQWTKNAVAMAHCPAGFRIADWEAVWRAGHRGMMIAFSHSPCENGLMPLPWGHVGDNQLRAMIEEAALVDPQARAALVAHASGRLLLLTRKMFQDFPGLRRWEETDDVFQSAMIRFHRALGGVEVASVDHFFHLAAVQVRRELLDLVKHHFGPEGAGRWHHTDGMAPDERGGSLHVRAGEPENLSDWSDFHAAIDGLPSDERAIFDLVYYQGLSQEEAARVLGLSFRTLKRRWQSAKLRLHGILSDDSQRRGDPG